MSIYYVTGNPTAVPNAANTELLQGLATSTGGFRIRRGRIGQITNESLTGIIWQVNKYTGAFTVGSGGTTITPAKQLTGMGSAISTWLQLNNTAISGGTKTTLGNFMMQDVAGDEDRPLDPEWFTFGPSEACQILLVTAFGASTNLAYLFTIEELFA